MSESIIAKIGYSTNPEAAQAGYDAAVSAREQLSSGQPRVALVFASSWFDQAALIKGVRSVLGDIPLVGMSTAGEIIAQGPLTQSCIVVLLAASAVTCSVGMAEEVSRDPRNAGQQAAFAAMRNFPAIQRTGCVLFGDGLVTRYAEVVRGIQEVFGTGSLIVGGLAGDDLRLVKTFQYYHDRILNDAIVGVLFGGAMKFGIGMEHGFAPISKPRKITKAHANRLYELDHHSAVSVYEEYFGAQLLEHLEREGLTRQRVAYPLGIQRETSGQWLLRNVVSFETDGSLLCTGDIPEGSWLQLMIGSRELALDAAHNAAQQAVRPLNRVACVLVFDSIVRRLLLGPQQASVEISCIRDVIGASTPLAGCYTYGEEACMGNTAARERIAIQTGSVLVVALGT